MLLFNATSVPLNVKSAASASVQVYYYPKAAHLLCIHTRQYVNLESEQITSVMWPYVTDPNHVQTRFCGVPAQPHTIFRDGHRIWP